MRADTSWDAAGSPASRCSAHKPVGARADAAAIDVSRKKWRRDGAELITFFIVQPCDGTRRPRISGSMGAAFSDASLSVPSDWNMMANKLWANIHGVCLAGDVWRPGFETAFRSPGLRWIAR